MLKRCVTATQVEKSHKVNKLFANISHHSPLVIPDQVRLYLKKKTLSVLN